MLITRVMPCLLLSEDSLVKTIQFKHPHYIGDPINAVRIYNQKEVDELIIIDINASKNKTIQFDLIEHIATECFMPLTYGGGVSSMEDFHKIFASGVEKIIVNQSMINKPELVRQAIKAFGSQSIIACIDVKKTWITKKHKIWNHLTKKYLTTDIIDYAKQLEDLGIGELIVYSVDQDGTWQGYDIPLVQQIADAVTIPTIAVGGAGSLKDIEKVVKEGHASAAGIGSMAVFQQKGLGVLIKFPTSTELEKILN